MSTGQFLLRMLELMAIAMVIQFVVIYTFMMLMSGLMRWYKRRRRRRTRDLRWIFPPSGFTRRGPHDS